MEQNGGAQRRFRKRGGAKKKKKPQPNDDSFPAEENTQQHESRFQKKPDYPADHNQSAPYSSRGFQSYESQLDPELARYLYQLRDDLDRLERDPASREAEDDGGDSPVLLLSRNGLSSLQPHLHEVALEPMGSRVLETLIRGAQDDPAALGKTLSGFLALGARRVAALAQHRCGSHVFQSLVGSVSSAIFTGNGNDAVVDAMGALGRVLGAWEVAEVAEVMSSSCGSHVFRAIVAALAGLPAEEPKEQKLDDAAGSNRLKTYIEQGRVEVPQEWLQVLASLGERLVEGDTDSGLQNLLWAPASSAAFQGLLSAVSCADRDVAKRLVKGAVKDASYLDVSFDSCGARFMERVVVCLGSGYVMADLKGHLAQMADDGKANFVLQRVLLGLRGRGSVMSAWDELEPLLPKITGIGSAREGVVLAMIRAAECEGDEQARRRAARSIGKAVGATGSNAKHLVGILLTGDLDRWESWRRNVKTWDNDGMGVPPAKKSEEDETSVLYYGGAPGLSLLGILMARSLMRFPGGPGQACRDSMANLSPVEVLALCSHPVGSRLVEQWTALDSESGSGKAVSFVVNAVLDTGTMGALSRSPYGAQVLSRTIPRASGPLRRLAMEALAARARHLREHNNGRQVIRKCRVDDYMRRGDEWETAETARDTRHRLFEDIIGPEEETGDVAPEVGVDRGDDVAGKQEAPREPSKREARRKRDGERSKAGESAVSCALERCAGGGEGENEPQDDNHDDLRRDAGIPVGLKSGAETAKGADLERKAKKERKRIRKKARESGDKEHGGPGLDNVLSAISQAAEPKKKKRRNSEGK